jgi:hypothetical protein
MAKGKKKKPVRRNKARRSRALGALGLPPDQHATREATFSEKLNAKVAGMNEDLKDKNRCEIAFAKLIDVSVYGGMAEAEAEGHGKSGQQYAAKVADAMSAFKRVCRVG